MSRGAIIVQDRVKLKGMRAIFKKIIPFILVFTLFIVNTTPVLAADESDEAINEEIIYDVLVDRFNNGNQKHSDQIRLDDRSEERRVGKECRSGWWREHQKENTISE